MKIYSYRHFITGIFFTIIGISTIWTTNLTFTDAFDWLELGKSLFFIICSFLIAGYQFYITFSKKGLKEHDLEEKDERNQLIDKSVDAMIGKIAYNMIFVLSLLFIILWAIFKIGTLLWIGAAFSILYTTLLFISFAVVVYYEKKF